MKTAHNLRTGPAIAKGEHLTASNDCCNFNCRQGRDCECSRQATEDAMDSWVVRILAGGIFLAVAAATHDAWLPVLVEWLL